MGGFTLEDTKEKFLYNSFNSKRHHTNFKNIFMINSLSIYAYLKYIMFWFYFHFSLPFKGFYSLGLLLVLYLSIQMQQPVIQDVHKIYQSVIISRTILTKGKTELIHFFIYVIQAWWTFVNKGEKLNNEK